MIVPLALGCLINTFAPHTANFFGSFTGALFHGALPILAVFYFCMGTTISFENLPRVAGKGGVLLGCKVLLGIACGIIVGRLLGEGPITSGWFAGLSTLAVVAAINDTNGGLYMALMGQYGTADDAAAYSVMTLESGPFLTMVTLGVAGLAAFPWQALVGAVLPLAIGILVGNFDRKMRDFLSPATPVMIPFFAFSLGASLDLHKVWQAGLLGLVLGLFVLVVSGIVMLVADRATGGKGTAGIAAASTAGNAAAVPMIVASANSAYAAAAGPATVLIASSIIVTSILTPLLTAWWAKRVGVGASA